MERTDPSATFDPTAEREFIQRRIAEIDRHVPSKPVNLWIVIVGGLVTGPALFAAGALFAKYFL